MNGAARLPLRSAPRGGAASPTPSRPQARAPTEPWPRRPPPGLTCPWPPPPPPENLANSTATRWPPRFSLPALRKHTLRPGSGPSRSQPPPATRTEQGETRFRLGACVIFRPQPQAQRAQARKCASPGLRGWAGPSRRERGRGLARCPGRRSWAWSGRSVQLREPQVDELDSGILMEGARLGVPAWSPACDTPQERACFGGPWGVASVGGS